MEFTEQNLSKYYDPHDLKDLIKDYYNLDSLTMETMEDILREGAEINSMNRISKETYEKLIKALGIPLDRSLLSPRVGTSIFSHITPIASNRTSINFDGEMEEKEKSPN